MNIKEKHFEVILSDYQDMIYRLCCSYVANGDLRKDLYQNILIRIWKGLDSFENRSSITTWIYRIAVNSSLDFLRKESKNKHLSNLLEINEADIIDNSIHIEENLILSEKMKFIYRCINKLTFIDKTVMSLYLEDLSYKKISEIVGISEKNVSVKLTRIKKKLNTCLRDN